MILAAGWVLLKSLNGGVPAKLISIASLGLLVRTRIYPLALLALGAAALAGAFLLGVDLRWQP